MHKKEELITQLHEVATFMKILGENDFKIRAFEKGADALEVTHEKLSDVASGKVKIAGVGEGLKGAVREFLKDGRVAAHAELSGNLPAGVLEVMNVPGVGPKKAKQLCEELSISSVGELEYACKENRLIGLKGFGQAAQSKILEAVIKMKSYAGKLRIDDAMELATRLEAGLLKKYPKAEVVRVGQLSRFCEIIDHIEFAVIHPKARAETKKLEEGLPFTVWPFAKKPTEAELRYLCADDGVRAQMKKNPKPFSDYENSWLESFWVGEKREVPKDAYRLKRDGHVKGIFHNHTVLSDGINTLEEMVLAAEKLGYEYIGISDHSQSAFYANGVKPAQIKAQGNAIKALQKKVSIRIFHGVESDILADGALDYDDEILDGFDFIVGSIHSRFKMEETKMTARLVKAIKNPRITMWGHPTGRILLARDAYKLDWKKCLDALEKSGTVIEINANPQRLDVDWRWGAELEKRGIPVCINPDAHSIEGLSDTVFGEHIAEKAILHKKQVLNLMNVNEMETWLSNRKKRAG